MHRLVSQSLAATARLVRSTETTRFRTEQLGNGVALVEADTAPKAAGLQIVLSFDLEEHFRIEAAVGLPTDAALETYYGARLNVSTRWLLDELAARDIRGTFFVLGQTADDNPKLIRAIQASGHEVASHGWNHRRLHTLNPSSFRKDVQQSVDAIEQATGEPVQGYRAPTFSIVRQTSWAVDVLAELGLRYDSSVYPVRHDRYGVPHAPRGPFNLRGQHASILELPLATWRVLGMNVPTGGGGYFRLFPLFFLEQTLRQVRRRGQPPVAVVYFHPWEFDPQQARLPLTGLRWFRTYVGIDKSSARLGRLLAQHQFVRAADVVRQLAQQPLPHYCLA
jgi:polysaccharide deacetylase family protein (PEP-CTERM system associated)